MTESGQVSCVVEGLKNTRMVERKLVRRLGMRLSPFIYQGTTTEHVEGREGRCRSQFSAGFAKQFKITFAPISLVSTSFQFVPDLTSLCSSLIHRHCHLSLSLCLFRLLVCSLKVLRSNSRDISDLPDIIPATDMLSSREHNPSLLRDRFSPMHHG